jgi:hypothetical protein
MSEQSSGETQAKFGVVAALARRDEIMTGLR